MSVELLEVPAKGSLDSIRVYWHNVAPHQGYVTIVCWGCAWNSWFGGMPAETVQEFFAMADTAYLVNRMGNTQWLKPSKRHENYLASLICAIKEALKPA